MLRRLHLLLVGSLAVVLVTCAAPRVDPTPIPTNAKLRPIPGLTADDLTAALEAAGLQCGGPASEPPGWACVGTLDPGVETIGTHAIYDGRLVTRIYAYVGARARPDFDDYATTFFRDVVMPTLLEPDELPSFPDIRTAAQTSGKIVVGKIVFQFLESSTTRAVEVTYGTP